MKKINLTNLEPSLQIQRIKKRLKKEKITNLQEATTIIKGYEVSGAASLLFRQMYGKEGEIPSGTVENLLNSIN